MLLQLGSLLMLSLFIASYLVTGKRALHSLGSLINWNLDFAHPGYFQEVFQDAKNKRCMLSAQEHRMFFPYTLISCKFKVPKMVCTHQKWNGFK